MKILISWSGKESHKIAIILRGWLPIVVPADPWVSSKDIRKGKRWNQELAKQLEDIQFGIFCMIANNVTAPWIHFEAGALSKWIEEASVVPLLFGGLSVASLSEPLQQFQATLFQKDDTWRLILDINRALGEDAIDEGRLKKSFEFSWPSLQEKIASILDNSKIDLELSTTVSDSQNSVIELELQTKHKVILSAFAKSEDGSSTIDELVDEVRMNRVRLKHHLEELVDHDFLSVNRATMVGEIYTLTRKGREYLINEGII